MIYTSSEGEEKLFPDYFTQPASDRLHGRYSGTARVRDTFDKISFDSSRRNSDLIGEINAGWGDMGLHPETFWLGYIGSGSAAWHPGSPHPGETISTFYPLFYGPDVVDMDRVYQLLSTQAQFWADSWDETDSKARKPIWGNSYAIYDTPHPAHDQTFHCRPHRTDNWITRPNGLGERETPRPGIDFPATERNPDGTLGREHPTRTTQPVQSRSLTCRLRGCAVKTWTC